MNDGVGAIKKSRSTIRINVKSNHIQNAQRSIVMRSYATRSFIHWEFTEKKQNQTVRCTEEKKTHAHTQRMFGEINFFSVLAVICYSKLRYCVDCVRSIGFDNHKITQMNFHFISLCILTCDERTEAHGERERAAKEKQCKKRWSIDRRHEISTQLLSLLNEQFMRFPLQASNRKLWHFHRNFSTKIVAFLFETVLLTVYAIFLHKWMQKT